MTKHKSTAVIHGLQFIRNIFDAELKKLDAEKSAKPRNPRIKRVF